MKDVKITFTATDLRGNLKVTSYNAYLSRKDIDKQVAAFIKSGYPFTIVSVYTGEVLAKG
jgi:ribulose bisphosphate carboxylase small subunit